MKEHEALQTPIVQSLETDQESIQAGIPQRRPYFTPRIFQHRIDHIVAQGGSAAPDGFSGTKSVS